MIKHYCDHCGAEIDPKEIVKINVRIRFRLPRLEREMEMHRECLDKAFGAGFVDGILAEDFESQKRREAKAQERLKKQQEAT